MSATDEKSVAICVPVPKVNELMKKTKPQLIRLGKQYGLLLSSAYKKITMARMIIEKIKSLNSKKNNQNKEKKGHTRANTVNIKRGKQQKKNDKKRIRNESRNSAPSSLLLSQSNSNTNILGTEALPEDHTNDDQYENKSETPLLLSILTEDKEDNDEHNFQEEVQKHSHRNINHTRSNSEIKIIVQAPKEQYKISGIRLFNQVRNIKNKIPMKLQHDQCKLFYGGKELNDNQTIAELKANIDNVSSYRFRLLISWDRFEPNQKLPHPNKLEHKNMLDVVSEMKKLNELNVFNQFLIGYTKQCKFDINQFEDIELKYNVVEIIYEYCICLSGDKTYERRWTKLHSIIFDYQNNIIDIVTLLKQENLYIDAWPHSGFDTPLKLAINRAIPNRNDDQK
eukprot:231150_1